ncbi:hypothetical protein ED733_000242 [Metarhizium rileyi]|uniref:Protein kinase-like domain protein n=1 Tax=Metarhizium rileyi (strain RCEF 4871) TaxID=1649241 RepID=A0A5C6FYD0_METRR|nr:hypothetical protein ED733_000242 [Metarhizium rileyi]
MHSIGTAELAALSSRNHSQSPPTLNVIEECIERRAQEKSPIGLPSSAFSNPQTMVGLGDRILSLPIQLLRNSIHFVERVGGGLDGYNWKIQVPKGGPTYVLKLFWDTEPWYPHYFSAQRECQNAALFQHIEAAVLDAAGPGNEKGPILLNPEPESKQDALANLLAFSNEARQHNMGKQSHNLLSIDEIGKIPRVRQCHGWLKVTGKELRDHWVRSSCREFEPPPILVDKVVRSIDNTELYTAVVYEFIEETHNDHDVVHSVLDFFWRAGFSHAQSPKEENWKAGVLVDWSDIASPVSYGWKLTRYGKRDAKFVLKK